MKYFELNKCDVQTNQSFLALLNKYILMDVAQTASSKSDIKNR